MNHGEPEVARLPALPAGARKALSTCDVISRLATQHGTLLAITLVRLESALQSFNETTSRSAAEFRAIQNETHGRGKRSQEHYDATGISYSTDEVVCKLRAKTQRRREQLPRK